MDSKLSIRDICLQAPVIPVLVVENVEQSSMLAATLVESGLPVLEVTLRTPAALGVIRHMNDVEGAIVGAGTVLTPQDVVNAKKAGACFAVSPGATDDLIKAAQDEALPLLPGAATATELMYLREQGFDTLKFFPAGAAGGIPMLKSFYGPFPDIMFCPTGGVSESNAQEYLALPNVCCVGGSWIAPSDWLTTHSATTEAEWLPIRTIAKKASSL